MSRVLSVFLNLRLRSKLLLSYIIISFISIGIVSFAIYKIYETNSKDNAIIYTKHLVEQITSNISFKAKDFEDNILLQARNYKLFVKKDEWGDLAERFYYEDLVNFATRLALLRPEVSEVYLQDRALVTYYYKRHTKESKYQEADIHLYIQENYKKIRDNWGIPIWFRSKNNPDVIYMVRAISSYETIEYQGIIAVGISIDYFKNLYSSLDKEQSKRVIVYNNMGDVLASDESLSPMEEYFKKFIQRDTGVSSYFAAYAENNYLLSTYTSIDARWTALYITDTRNLLDDKYKIGHYIFIACIFSFVLALVIAMIISKNITSSIHLLQKKIKLIETGDFTVNIEPTSYDEFGQLCLKFNTMVKRLNELIERITYERLEKQKAEYKALKAEFNALQAQMNPHFLYNVLESISSFAKIKSQWEIADIATALGNLLRASIRNRKSVILFKEELEYVKNYLHIQKVLSGDRIEIEYDIDEDVLDYGVPKLVLQPIIENAIIHGIEEMRENGVIIISAHKSDNKDALIIQVSDNGKGMNENTIHNLLNNYDEGLEVSEKHTHLGIRSVDKRIKILCGESYGLRITSEIGIGTVVNILIPRIEEGGRINNV